MRTEILERLKALRAEMQKAGIDAYLVPTDDFHSSEYVGDYFKCRKFITGFTGSAGTAVITQEMAGLWTDGRYFIQAAQQLEGTTVELFKMGEPGVPTIHEFLKETLKEGQTLGFDGRTVGAKEKEDFASELAEKKVRVVNNADLVGKIWTDRPDLPHGAVMELDTCWCGESRAEKLARIRDLMKEQGAEALVLSSLDDIAWLLNIRGNDVRCNPVVLSYLLLQQEQVLLFASDRSITPEIQESLAKDGVKLCPYNDIYTAVTELAAGSTVWVCKAKANSLLVEAIPETVTVLDKENPTLLPKSIKNAVEAENERKAHIKDGVAVTKFIHWMKTNVGKTAITEISAAEKLFELRKEQENFLGDSFDPIISYGPHAAIVHYSATPESDVEMKPQGMVLCDTGGQYLEGTTDITRTVVLGPTTEEEKKMFTAVLRGHINLADAVFRYGCTGLNLDYLAREPLWRMGKDYNHGTGHGVGYLLNVHEGPNGFRWRVVPERNDSAVLEEGMITSDEPGYYEENKFGIRHESLLLCKKGQKTEVGQFMEFEELTMVPFDLEAILPEEMSARERELLNQYHETVYKTLAPYMNEEELTWLKEQTRAI